MYGVPHGYGANLLMYNTEVVTPAPTSWSAVFDGASAYSGKVTAYDSPIYIADAALYLMNDPARPRHRGPVRPRRRPARRGGRPAQGSSASTSASTGPTTSRRSRPSAPATSVVGTTWQVIVNLAQADKAPGRGDPARGGLDRLVGHLDDLRGHRGPELRLRLAQPHHQPGGQRRRGRVVRRGAGQQQGLRPGRARASARPTTRATRPTPSRSGTGRRRSSSASTGAPT